MLNNCAKIIMKSYYLKDKHIGANLNCVKLKLDALWMLELNQIPVNTNLKLASHHEFEFRIATNTIDLFIILYMDVNT